MGNSKLSISDKISGLNFIEFSAGLLLIFLLFIRFVYIFTYHTDLEGVEFALVHFVQMIVLKGHLYGNAARFPYLLVVHAPLYYYFMAWIMKVFTIDVVNDVHLMYVIGRSISLMLLFINYYLLLRIILVLSPKFRYKIYLVLIFTLFLPSHFYACRPDSLKLTFFVLFLYFSIQYFKNNKWIHNSFALFFLTLSVICKQDILVYGLSLYAVFFLIKRKIAFVVSPVLILIIISGGIYIYYLNSGINLLKELLFYNLQYDSDMSINFLLISSHYVRIFPLLAFTFLNIKSKNKLSLSLMILSLFYIVISSLLMLRSGSNINYTYESVILLLINVVIFLDESEIKFHRYLIYSSNYLICTYFILLFIFNNILYYKPYFLSKTELNYKNEFYSSLQSSKKIKNVVGENVLFIPDMKYYIFYPDVKLIYGSDWHYERYCEIALNIKIVPKFIHNEIVAKYDKQFTNGLVQYILVENNYKSKYHVSAYYPNFELYQLIDNFILYKYQPTQNSETDTKI